MKLTQQNLLIVDTIGYPTSSTQHPHVEFIADIGSGDHLMTTKVPATNIAPVQYGKVTIIIDFNTIHSTHKELLKLNIISDDAGTAHLFPGLKSGALISLGNICDDGCDITINSRQLNIHKRETPHD